MDQEIKEQKYNEQIWKLVLPDNNIKYTENEKKKYLQEYINKCDNELYKVCK